MEAAPTAPPPAQDVVEPPSAPADDTPPEMKLEIREFNEWATAQGLIGDVYFDFDKYDLKPEARDRLAKNAAFMRDYPTVKITVEGHCDERGSEEYNLALGDRRASGVKRYLVDLGVSASRLRTVSFGEAKPAVVGHDESAWRYNRRSEFKSSP